VPNMRVRHEHNAVKFLLSAKEIFSYVTMRSFVLFPQIGHKIEL
jgi:hypothetical protein